MAEVPHRESNDHPVCMEKKPVLSARIKRAGKKVEKRVTRGRKMLVKKERERKELVKEPE